uniref:Uncharacterized protein n=1 Tax=Anguilla anguilla TaxID=7936 RepID=A0A0E9QUX8_ANGAN
MPVISSDNETNILDNLKTCLDVEGVRVVASMQCQYHIRII